MLRGDRLPAFDPGGIAAQRQRADLPGDVDFRLRALGALDP